MRNRRALRAENFRLDVPPSSVVATPDHYLPTRPTAGFVVIQATVSRRAADSSPALKQRPHRRRLRAKRCEQPRVYHLLTRPMSREIGGGPGQGGRHGGRRQRVGLLAPAAKKKAHEYFRLKPTLSRPPHKQIAARYTIAEKSNNSVYRLLTTSNGTTMVNKV
ncbi:hypothetical protein Bbelb_225710 [Branchiostoma belcheri]|nr:hypothetical protein Bbelb_225710 [Branchiostoma belcheri]